MSVISDQLQQLVGLELTRTTRAGLMECLKFGHLLVSDEGNWLNIGQFGLHLQCPWRLAKNHTLLVGEADVYEQPNEEADYDEEFEWDRDMGNLRDQKLATLIQQKGLLVMSVKVDNFGGFELVFENQVKLIVFPTLSSKADGGEYWRLIGNQSAESSHFVVGSTGII